MTAATAGMQETMMPIVFSMILVFQQCISKRLKITMIGEREGGGRREGTHVIMNTGTASQVISAVDSNLMRTMTVRMLHTQALQRMRSRK